MIIKIKIIIPNVIIIEKVIMTLLLIPVMIIKLVVHFLW